MSDAIAASPALRVVSAVFESIGRALVCLDERFRVVHTSSGELASHFRGHSVDELLGDELFGAAGSLRALLEKGEMREEWRVTMRNAAAPRTVSLTIAPFVHGEVRYVLILHPVEDDGMIARSAAMAKIVALVQNLRWSDATVLLTGESGTGKEVVARLIHANSMRRDRPFVAIHCGALPGELLQAELFGRFELAAGGTLFLDEVGDVPLQLQATLLSVLQAPTYDARIIAATRLDLHRAIAESRFREDLFHHLRAVPIDMPPLRARREDIEPLAHFLLTRVAARHGRELRFSPDAICAVLRYRWPGNVREMENAIEYAVAVVKGQTIHAEDLPLEVTGAAEPPPVRLPVRGDGESATIRAALESHRWNRETTARFLGMSRTTLWRKMRELGLI